MIASTERIRHFTLPSCLLAFDSTCIRHNIAATPQTPRHLPSLTPWLQEFRKFGQRVKRYDICVRPARAPSLHPHVCVCAFVCIYVCWCVTLSWNPTRKSMQRRLSGWKHARIFFGDCLIFLLTEHKLLCFHEHQTLFQITFHYHHMELSDNSCVWIFSLNLIKSN